MQSRMHLLRTANEMLCEWELPLRDRLKLAGELFPGVLSGNWPAALEERAQRIAEQLTVKGPVAVSVAAMDEDTVPAIASQIVEFIEDAERLLAARLN